MPESNVTQNQQLFNRHKEVKTEIEIRLKLVKTILDKKSFINEFIDKFPSMDEMFLDVVEKERGRLDKRKDFLKISKESFKNRKIDTKEFDCKIADIEEFLLYDYPNHQAKMVSFKDQAELKLPFISPNDGRLHFEIMEVISDVKALIGRSDEWKERYYRCKKFKEFIANLRERKPIPEILSMCKEILDFRMTNLEQLPRDISKILSDMRASFEDSKKIQNDLDRNDGDNRLISELNNKKRGLSNALDQLIIKTEEI